MTSGYPSWKTADAETAKTSRIDVAFVVMLALGFGYHILRRAWEHGYQHAQEQVSSQHAPVAEYAVDPTPSGKTRRRGVANPLWPR